MPEHTLSHTLRLSVTIVLTLRSPPTTAPADAAPPHSGSPRRCGRRRTRASAQPLVPGRRRRRGCFPCPRPPPAAASSSLALRPGCTLWPRGQACKLVLSIVLVTWPSWLHLVMLVGLDRSYAPYHIRIATARALMLFGICVRTHRISCWDLLSNSTRCCGQ